jgi:hypothetical protein
MTSRLAAVFSIVAALLLVGCGGSSDHGVALHWQTEDGRALQVSFDNLAAAHGTLITVDNDSGRTITDAVLRFSPTTTQHAPVGFSVGTVTNVHTDFDGDAHLWRLGDIKPNTRVVFPIGLWFATVQQVDSAAPIDLTVELDSADLTDAVISNALTVRFQ